MIERPIIFSGEMVRAILRTISPKLQTRRVLRQQPKAEVHYDRATGGAMWGSMRGDHGIACPFGKPGDRLWVRETHAGDNCCGWVYRADHPTANISAGDLDDGEQSLRRWTPAIHMKREACRLVLEVISVRVERLQEISEHDAFTEGCRSTAVVNAAGDDYTGLYASEHYALLWDSLNAKRGHGWATNPWVWVICFERAR